MKKNKSPQDLVLSTLLSMDYSSCINVINKFKNEWFETSLQKRIFKAIQDIITTGNEPNMLKVVSILKSNKDLEAGDIGKISNLSSFSPSWKVSITGLVEVLREEYQKKSIQTTLNIINRNILEHNFNASTVIDEVERLKGVLTETDDFEKTNPEIIDDVIESHNNAKCGNINGMELGLSNLSGKILLEPVDMMVIGARPAMGKTGFSITLIKKLVFDQDKKVVLFSLEMSKEQIIRRLLSRLLDIDSNKIKYGNCTSAELKKMEYLKSTPEFNNLKIYEGTHTASELRRRVTEQKYTVGCDLFIVDYLQKLKGENKKSKYEIVSDASNIIKETTMDLQIPSIALAQLSRSVEQRGGNRMPTLSDLRESGEIEQDASIIGFLYRPEYYGINEFEDGESTKGRGQLLMAKNREGELGEYNFNVDLKTSNWSPFFYETNFNFVNTNEIDF